MFFFINFLHSLESGVMAFFPEILLNQELYLIFLLLYKEMACPNIIYSLSKNYFIDYEVVSLQELLFLYVNLCNHKLFLKKACLIVHRNESMQLEKLFQKFKGCNHNLCCLFVLRQHCCRDFQSTFKKLHSKKYTAISILELKANITY